MTSICFKRNKRFNTKFGIFTYKYLAEELFPIGIEIQKTSEGNFHIASKEKALCDLAYFTKLKNDGEAIEYVIDNLRISKEDIRQLNSSLLLQIAKNYRRGSVGHLVNGLVSLINE